MGSVHEVSGAGSVAPAALPQCDVPCCPECDGEALTAFTSIGARCPRCRQSWLRAEWRRCAGRPSMWVEDEAGRSHGLCLRHGRDPLAPPPGTRRAAPRKRLEVDVTFESDDNLYAGLTRDISSGGLFVATSVLLPVGTLVGVRLTLPGMNEPLSLCARVRWTRSPRLHAPDMPPGMGLEIVDLGAGERRALDAFMQRREPMMYEV